MFLTSISATHIQLVYPDLVRVKMLKSEDRNAPLSPIPACPAAYPCF